MHNVVSFWDVRTERLKESLGALAARREGAIVRGRSGEPICACRIFCRDQGVVLIDRYGFQSHLGYAEILDAIPMPRISASLSANGRQGWEIAAGWKKERADNVIAFRRPV